RVDSLPAVAPAPRQPERSTLSERRAARAPEPRRADVRAGDPGLGQLRWVRVSWGRRRATDQRGALNMKRRGMIGLFFVVLAGAGGRKGAPPLASSSLWALAPPSADFAVVVRDGALPQLLRGVRVLATKTDPAVAAEIRNELRRLPVDVLDDASLKAAGVDA